MSNLTITNTNPNSSIFQRVYNFSVPDRAFLDNSYNASNSNINKKNRRQKYRNWGLLAVGCGALFLSRGVQKKTRNLLENAKEYLHHRQDKYFFDENKPRLPFYDYATRKINSFIRKTESINNANSIKDMLFMKLMYKTTPTGFIHKKVSSFFEFLSRNTVIKSYKNTQKHFNEMFTNFDKLDEYILKHSADEEVIYNGEKCSKKELIEKARDSRSIVRMVVNAFIDKSAQNVRYDYIKESASTLYSKIWDSSFKDFWSKDNKFKRKEMWQTFIAAEKIKSNKTDLTKNVAFARNILSYTDAEKKAYIWACINNLNAIIPANDTKAIEILERLKWYVKDSSMLTDNNTYFVKELDELEKHNIRIKNDVYNREPKLLEDKNTNIRLIRSLIREDAPGDIEKITDIYKKIAPMELSQSGALKSLKRAVTSFDKSINLEVNELFDKLRDLEIGSAPTDILTILFSSALIACALEKAKNKEERTSIMLKSGIPIAGAITVTLISAAKLVSGGKSLALGFISGFIMNRIGKAVDNYHKESIKHNK